MDIPHSREAEESLIGSILINPITYYDVAAFITGEDFYLHKNRWIWEAFTALVDHATPIDITTVCQELTNKNHLEEIGGQAYITGMLSVVPSAMNADAYARIIEDYSMRRRSIAVASSLANAAYNTSNPFDPGEYLNEALRSSRFTGRRTNEENLSAYLDWYMSRLANPGKLSGLPSGIKSFDLITDGLEKGTTTMFAGAEGIGKSMISAQIALNIARFKYGAVIYSLEISDIMIINRWVSVITGIEAHKIKRGELSDIQQGQVAEAVNHLEGLIHIVADSNLTTSQIRADIMRRKSSGDKVDFIVIDYSGKLKDKSERGQEELDRLATCIERVRNIGSAMNVAILLIHTLNAEDGISGRRNARYDVDNIVKFTRTEGFGNGADADRHVTMTVTKLRDQNSVGVSNKARLLRAEKYPWFTEEVQT